MPQRALEEPSQVIAITGLLLYAAFAPHSVAASTIGIALAGLGWLLRSVGTGTLGLRRSKFDLIIILAIVWTVASAAFSEEPAISVAKLQSLWVVFIFYLTRAILSPPQGSNREQSTRYKASTTRRVALSLVVVLILSGCAGAVYSLIDLSRGRGVVVESLAQNSPFHQVQAQPGDTIWRIGHRRIYSAAEVDETLRQAPANTPLRVSIISHGEHVERSGLVLTATQQQQPSPSGLTGDRRNHRFRASGWTRHYQTFAEVLQMIALLALGLALAHLRNHGANKFFKVLLVAVSLLALGIVFTAMRTVIVALAIGACVIGWRAVRGIAPKIVFSFALLMILAGGAVVVSQTRARNALSLDDPSSSLRLEVARAGLSRILLHPVFGHGMDAMQLHWNEWGFPGKDMLHLHSTPLQLAFDRGLPMLALWLWLMTAFWFHIAGAEKQAADFSDTNFYGILLGTLGALTGFLASSLVNYNYGDSEVVMLFWLLMGIASQSQITERAA